MKNLLIFLVCIISFNGYSCDDSLKTFLLDYTSDFENDVLLQDVGTILKKSFENSQNEKFEAVIIIEDQTGSKIAGFTGIDLQRSSELSKNISNEPEEFRVLGLSSDDALDLSGDFRESFACSQDHMQGDMANRWCHAGVVKISQNTILDQLKVNDYVKNILAAAIFLPKEYLYDTHASPSDLVISDIPILEGEEESVKITIFGDGFFHINYEGKF